MAENRAAKESRGKRAPHLLADIMGITRGEPKISRPTGRCGDQPRVLNARLAELKEAGLVELTDDGYRLTKAGLDLIELLLPLYAWSEAWAADMRRPKREEKNCGLTRSTAVGVYANACSPVMARPRIRAWMSWVPS